MEVYKRADSDRQSKDSDYNSPVQGILVNGGGNMMGNEVLKRHEGAANKYNSQWNFSSHIPLSTHYPGCKGTTRAGTEKIDDQSDKYYNHRRYFTPILGFQGSQLLGFLGEISGGGV